MSMSDQTRRMRPSSSSWKTFSAKRTRRPLTGRPKRSPAGVPFEGEAAGDPGRFGHEERDGGAEVGDRAEIRLEHGAVAGEAERTAIVLGAGVDEGTEALPALPVEAGDVAAVEVRQALGAHGAALPVRRPEPGFLAPSGGGADVAGLGMRAGPFGMLGGRPCWPGSLRSSSPPWRSWEPSAIGVHAPGLSASGAVGALFVTVRGWLAPAPHIQRLAPASHAA